LTGDVGRGCGDASRALLLSAEIGRYSSYRPTIRPTFGDRISARIFAWGNEILVMKAASGVPQVEFRENAGLRELTSKTRKRPSGA
jgi:hypothetical protein